MIRWTLLAALLPLLAAPARAGDPPAPVEAPPPEPPGPDAWFRGLAGPVPSS